MNNILPNPKHGMRRLWNNDRWIYSPVRFPSMWNKKTEFLIWDCETDTWERVKKRNGFIPHQTRKNYVRENLILRNTTLQQKRDITELNNIYTTIQQHIGYSSLSETVKQLF